MTMYKHVAMNICKEDNRYRVRYQKKGRRFSKSFTSMKAAVKFRKEKLGY